MGNTPGVYFVKVSDGKALCVDPLEITYTDTATGNVTNYQIHNWHVRGIPLRSLPC